MDKFWCRGCSSFNSVEPILFLTYINDLSDNLTTKPKLFADETSLFSVIDDQHPLVSKLNEDLNWKWFENEFEHRPEVCYKLGKLSFLVNLENQLIFH